MSVGDRGSAPDMQQLLPSIFHWTATHEPIGTRVSSYLVEPARAVIDPKLPEGGLESLPVRPEQILLSSGHHLRDARAFADAFGIPIRASHEAVAHLGSAGRDIEPWENGEGHPAPGITALHLGVICEDEGVLHIDVADGALLLADAVHADEDGLQFFDDSLLGDDPEGVKQGLKAALAALARSLDFDALLLAHGEPMASGGRAALREFSERA